MKVAASTVLRGVGKALKAVGVDSASIASFGGAPNVDPLGETYYSVTAFRSGDYIAKFSVAPALVSLTGTEIDAAGRPDAIRETVRSETRVEAVDERMRFGAWTGLAAHRPLGNINRARNAPYRHSADVRQRVNGRPIHEPDASRSEEAMMDGISEN